VNVSLTLSLRRVTRTLTKAKWRSFWVTMLCNSHEASTLFKLALRSAQRKESCKTPSRRPSSKTVRSTDLSHQRTHSKKLWLTEIIITEMTHTTTMRASSTILAPLLTVSWSESPIKKKPRKILKMLRMDKITLKSRKNLTKTNLGRVSADKAITSRV